MKNILVILIAALLLAACSGEEDADAPTTAAPLETVEPTPEPGQLPAVTLESPADYPPPPSESDPGTGPYPEPPLAEPTQDPYPGGVAVIYKAFGEQCADAAYESVEEAAAELEDNGIQVLEAEQVELGVCAACGCPTSEHARVEIDPADLDAALALGWSKE